MPQQPSATVVICTHNRVRYLEQALEGLRKQTLPANLFEVLVVDNCSTDDTPMVARGAAATLKNLRYCREDELGLSYARNRGLREATGDYIAYLDDDAVPDPDWLAAALDTFGSGGSKIGIVGGRVLPLWETPRPAWLIDDLLPYLTIIDLGDEVQEVDSITGIVGANMVFPRTLLIKMGGFPTQLGRKGKRLLSNEELVLKCKLKTAGYLAIYNPRAMVHHIAPRQRLTRRWFLNRLYWQGESDALWWRLEKHRNLPERITYLVSATVRLAKSVLVAPYRWARNADRGFRAMTFAFYHAGTVVGSSRSTIDA
jgi:glycosyltransferase involved in cell wall biosynthesis